MSNDMQSVDPAELERIEREICKSCGNDAVRIANFLLLLVGGMLSHISQAGRSSQLYKTFQKHLKEMLELRITFDRSKQA